MNTLILQLLYFVLVCIPYYSSVLGQKQCNVRDSSCQPHIYGTYKLDEYSTYQGQQLQWFFLFSPFDIYLTLQSSLSSDELIIRTKILDSFELAFHKHPEISPYAYKTQRVETIRTQAVDLEKLMPEEYVMSILQDIDQIYILGGGDRITFKKDASTVSFYKVKESVAIDPDLYLPLPLSTGSPVAVSTSTVVDPVSIYLKSRSLSVVPESYRVGGIVEPLFAIQHEHYPINIVVKHATDTSIDFMLSAVGIYEYHFSFNGKYITNSSGKKIISPSSYQQSKSDVTERKLLNIMDHPTTLSIENKGVLTIGSMIQSKYHEIKFQTPFEPATHIFLRTALQYHVIQYTSTFYQFTLKGTVEKVYEVFVDPSTYKILHVDIKDLGDIKPHIIQLHQHETVRKHEKEFEELMKVDHELVFYEAQKMFILRYQSKSIQVVPTTFMSQIKPHVNPEFTYYEVVPKTYMVDGKFNDLLKDYDTLYFNVTIGLHEIKSGLAYIELRISYSYYFTALFQSSDGWVIKVLKTELKPILQVNDRPPKVGLTLIEAKITSAMTELILGMQQISFDGSEIIQLIKDQAKTRISFKKLSASSDSQQKQDDSQKYEEFTYPEAFKFYVQEYKEQEGILKLQLKDNEFDCTYSIQFQPLESKVLHVDHQKVWSRQQESYSPARDAIHTILLTAKDVTHDDVKKTLTVQGTKDLVVMYFDAKSITDFEPGIMKRRLYDIKPETYQYKGQIQKFYHDDKVIPIILTLHKIQPGVIDVQLHLSQKLTYRVKYQEHDGYVLETVYRREYDVLHSSSYAEQLQEKLHGILSQVQQIAFEKDGIIQFITDAGSTRVSFKPLYHDVEYVKGEVQFHRVVEKTEYKQSSKCTIHVLTSGYLDCSCGEPGSTTRFSLIFDTDQKTIMKAQISETVPHSPIDTVVLGATHIVIASKRLQIFTPTRVFSLKLLDPSVVDFTRATYVPVERVLTTYDIYPRTNENSFVGDRHNISLGSYMLVTSSYHYLGQHRDLPPILKTVPVYIHVNETRDSYIQITLDVDGYHEVYDIYFNPSTKQVQRVELRLRGGFSKNLSYELTNAFEVYVKSIVVRASILSSTPSGLRFMTSDGSGITFSIHKVTKYELVPGTYLKDGVPQKWLETYHTNSPIYLILSQDYRYGKVRVALQGKKTYSYVLTIQPHDGWVLSREYAGQLTPTELKQTFFTEQELDAEQKIVDIISKVEQLSFETDGFLSFIADSAKTRVGFKKLSQGDYIYEMKVKDFGKKYLMPSTYMQSGELKTLSLTGPPVYIELKQPYEGAVAITYHGIDTFTVYYEYQYWDGWVEWSSIAEDKVPYWKSSQQVFPLTSEEALMTLVASAEQISFESSGQIQFIRDSTKTRVSFK